MSSSAFVYPFAPSPTNAAPLPSPPSAVGFVKRYQSVLGFSSSICVAALAAPKRNPPLPELPERGPSSGKVVAPDGESGLPDAGAASLPQPRSARDATIETETNLTTKSVHPHDTFLLRASRFSFSNARAVRARAGCRQGNRGSRRNGFGRRSLPCQRARVRRAARSRFDGLSPRVSSRREARALRHEIGRASCRERV